MKRTKRFSTITPFLKRYRHYLILGGIAIVLTNALALVIPYLTKLVFDLLEHHGSSQQILRLVLLSIGLAILSGVFRFFVRRTIIWASRHIEYHLRNKLFSHLLTLTPSFYHNTRTGDIMARATNDLEAVRMMIGPGIMHLANTVVTIVIAVSFMVYLSPKLTLYALAPMIVFPIFVNRLGNLVHQKFSKIQEFFSQLTAAVQENIAGVRVVRAYRQEEPEIEHFESMSNKYIDLNLDMARLYGVFFPLIMFLVSGINLGVLYFGGLDVIDQKIPFGTLVAFFAYVSMLFWPAFSLGWIVSLYQRGTASLDRINNILFTQPEVRNENGVEPTERMKGEIIFRNLHFTYDHHEVLKDITLTISAGQTVGIIGKTGSGKTTLVSLLARLYPVERGRIFIDGKDINDWELAALRRQIGFVTQEPFLFSDTIANNINFGNADVSTEQIIAASDIAALTKDIETFPDKFHTMVGERGITLSGGQKQRLAIARALLIDPAILVLDDATSSVDTETEDEINEHIQAELRKRTTIIISHRASSVKKADMIIYLHEGKIVEQGTHEELLKRNGYYAALYRSQLLEKELEQLA